MYRTFGSDGRVSIVSWFMGPAAVEAVRTYCTLFAPTVHCSLNYMGVNEE